MPANPWVLSTPVERLRNRCLIILFVSSPDPQQLAESFEETMNRFIEFLSSLSDDQWATTTDAEGWPVGVAAHHVAMGARFTIDLALHVADGGEITWTSEFIDSANEQHAQAFADIGSEDAIAALKEQLPEVSAKIRGLTTEQLSRRTQTPMEYGSGPIHLAGDVVQKMLIDHIEGHLESIKTTLEA